jgi:hypothetical protein
MSASFPYRIRMFCGRECGPRRWSPWGPWRVQCRCTHPHHQPGGSAGGGARTHLVGNSRWFGTHLILALRWWVRAHLVWLPPHARCQLIWQGTLFYSTLPCCGSRASHPAFCSVTGLWSHLWSVLPSLCCPPACVVGGRTVRPRFLVAAIGTRHYKPTRQFKTTRHCRPWRVTVLARACVIWYVVVAWRTL